MRTLNQRQRRCLPKAFSLFGLGVLLSGCVSNHSKDPEFANWVGHTVTLTTDHIVCISLPWAENPRWQDHFDLFKSTPYEMTEVHPSSCSPNHNEVIGTLPAGSLVEIVRFENKHGFLSPLGNRQAIVRVHIPSHDPDNLLAEVWLDKSEKGSYDFPWISLQD